MAGSLNKVTLIGHLGADPEVRAFPQGGKVCNLRIATSENWKDRNTGERREKTEWHRVAIYSEPLVRLAEQYLRKGSKIYLEGKLETRDWTDQSGAKRYTTEIAMRPYQSELKFLDSRNSGAPREGNAQGGNPAGYQGGNQGGYQGGNQGGYQGGTTGGPTTPAPTPPHGGGFDDEIPF